MFTPSFTQRLLGFGLFTLTILVSTSVSNAQIGVFQNRARFNGTAQRQYNAQNSMGMYQTARGSLANGHNYIAGQGYSNAYQTAYDQAWSNNAQTSAQGIRSLRRIARQQPLSQSNHGAFVRQSADNALYQLQQQQHSANVQANQQAVRAQRRTNILRAANAAATAMNAISQAQTASHGQTSAYPGGHTANRNYTYSPSHGTEIVYGQHYGK